MPVHIRGQFQYSVALGAGVMTACFLAVGAIGYSKLGSSGWDQTQPVTAVLQHDSICGHLR